MVDEEELQGLWSDFDVTYEAYFSAKDSDNAKNIVIELHEISLMIRLVEQGKPIDESTGY